MKLNLYQVQEPLHCYCLQYTTIHSNEEILTTYIEAPSSLEISAPKVCISGDG